MQLPLFNAVSLVEKSSFTNLNTDIYEKKFSFINPIIFYE